VKVTEEIVADKQFEIYKAPPTIAALSLKVPLSATN